MSPMNSYDDWVTADEIVKRILGDNAKENSAKVFIRDIASQPNFPKNSYFGKSRKVWCWGEISDYFRNERERAADPVEDIIKRSKGGRPRRITA